ncbi:MAG: YdeI/OmpD-associated family protein [Chloroflexota bacterium]
MTATDNFEKVTVTSSAELRAWLEANHEQDNSVWLVTYKKHMNEKYVSTEQILDEVLCFGWIDGIRRKLDDDRTMQLIAPRKTQHWAKSYKDRVARLEAEGRMHPAGLKVIEESKQNGLWTFMDDVDALIMPDDLVEALQEQPPAFENFEAAAPSYRRNVLRWIKLAKKPATRTKRIHKTATTSAAGEKIPQM